MSDSIHSPSTLNTNDYSQQEDAALKTAMQFFATDLLPFFQISGSVKGIAPTELISLELKKLFQDFNLIMEDGSWKHFEFQSKNEGLAKTDLVPLTLCLLMGGKMSLQDRVTEAFHIIRNATHLSYEDRSHMEAVLYLMADKFLEPAELNKLKEEIHMTQLGQMLVDWGIEQGIEQGIQQGIQKGAEQKTQEFIINALKLGLSDEDILRLTECTPDELQAARNRWLTEK